MANCRFGVVKCANFVYTVPKRKTEVLTMNLKINDSDKITMTHTGLLPGKSGKVIHVSFERKTAWRDDYAEIVLPSRKVVNSRGFDEGELAQLQIYLKEQEKNIVKSAKQIDRDLIFNL